MGYIVRMPKLGLEMEQGTLLEWTVGEGEEISEGDQVAEVESEKSIGEVEAREDGVLRRTYLDVEGAVPPGTPIGIVAAADADISDLEAEAEADLEADAADAEAGSGAAGSEADASATQETAEAGSTGGGGSRAGGGGGADVKASPRAEKRAEELGVDLTGVEGSGPGGAITADDVEAAAESGPPDVLGEAEAIRRIEPGETFQYERATAVAGQAAASGLFDTVEAVRSAFEGAVTMTDVLVLVAGAALADHPTLNGTYTEGTHHVQDSQQIGLVVDVGGDPTLGVISDATGRTLSGVVAAREQVGASGERDRGMPTFTLVDAAETETSDRLLAEPSVASLTVDPTGQRAVADGDGVDLRPLVTVDLTYDTRAVGGREAEAFLDSFLEYAEVASELVLGSYRGHE